MRRIPTRKVFVVLETRPDGDEMHSAVLNVHNSLRDAQSFLEWFEAKYGGVCEYDIQEASIPVEEVLQ